MQDIRQFFKPKHGTSSPGAANTPPAKKRPRKRMLIDSDSDEEPIKTPKSKGKEKTAKPSSKKEKRDSLNTSKYFEVDATAVKSLFGTEPVKQVSAPKPIDNRAVGENELADISDAFLDIDDDAWIQDVTSPNKQASAREKSEEPTSNSKSPATPSKTGQRAAGSPKLAGRKDDNFTKHDISPLNTPTKRKAPVEHCMSPEPSGEKMAKRSPEKKKKCTAPSTLSNGDKRSPSTPKHTSEAPKKIALELNNSPQSPVLPKKMSKPDASLTTSNGSTCSYTSKSKTRSSDFELWVEKYKPTNLKQIIGQQGDKSNVRKLVHWLKNWHSNHSGNKKLAKPSPWAKDSDGAYFKAALLSGPPGVGKTTTAHLVCKELGMDTVEFNASDTRSKKLLHEQITELLSSQSVTPFFTGGASTSKNHVLIMDEVDGMAGNEDRGGIQELISLIKNSKVPIICMCNDRNHPKIRSLVNYCFDLRFSKPRADQIKGSMMSICFKEGIKIKPDLLNNIITSTNQDIRLILNHLSMLAAKKDSEMMITNKELKLGAWDVLRKVFSETERSGMTIHDKLDLFFHDYSIAPLFVQENYLNVVPHSRSAKSKKDKMHLFAKTASALCHGDLVERAIRSQNAWSLLPAQGLFSTLIPGDTLEGHVGGMINFPAWLGKNSKKNKMDRLSQEIQSHTRLKASASNEAIRLDYAQAFRDTLLRPLTTNGSDGVADSLAVMKEYSLLREDIDSLNELCLWPGSKDLLSSVDSKVKAAFTRAYNKNPVLTPFSVSAAGVKKNRSGPSDDVSEDVYNEDGETNATVDDDEDEENPLADGMIKAKKPKVEKEPKKAKQETAGSSKPRGRGRGAKR